MPIPLFDNRSHAGRLLALKLDKYYRKEAAVVLGLPRGGVPVAEPVATHLHLPLDVFLVRKLGVPGHEELAMGAITTGDICIFNESIINRFAISQEAIEQIKKSEQAELMRRAALYRPDKPPLNVKGKTLIVVDDGLATGATMKVAVQALKLMQPQKIIIAIPVAATDCYKEFATLVDECVCLQLPDLFSSVGMWYQDFSQTTDNEVITLLHKRE